MSDYLYFEPAFEWGAPSAEELEVTRECGFDAFEAAELLQMITDRSAGQWGQETPADVMRARDILRAALVSVIALIGGDGSTVATRMSRAIEGSPDGRAMRDALRRGEQVALGDLLTLYAQVTREAEEPIPPYDSEEERAMQRAAIVEAEIAAEAAITREAK